MSRGLLAPKSVMTANVDSAQRSVTGRSCRLASCPATMIPFAFVILAGLLPRLDDFGRSLWTDEAWVANSVLADTLSQMFYYDRWLQCTPPLLLILVRYNVKIFGLSNYTLRAIPSMFGLLALVLFAELSCRVLRRPYAWLATAIIAVSPIAIVASKQLKQYSSDLAASVVILLVLWTYRKERDRRHWRWLLGAFIILLTLSYMVVIFIPLAIIVIYSSTPKREPGVASQSRRARTAWFIVAVTSLSSVIYFIFIRSNVSPRLTLNFRSGFPQGDAVEILRFYAKLIEVSIFYVLPLHWMPLFASLPSWLLASSIFLAAAMLCLATAAVLQQTDRMYLAAFCLVPLFTLLTLNVARMYPVSRLNLALCILPSGAIGLALGVEAVWESFVRLSLSASSRKVLRGVAAVLGLVFVSIPATMPQLWLDYQREDAEGAIRHLKSNAVSDDLIYVHASAAETSRLYFRMLGWDAAPLVYGQTGSPCCGRKSQPDDVLPSELQYHGDFDDVIRGARFRRLWLVFTGRREHWAYLKRDESEILTKRLYRLGCSNKSTTRLTNQVVYEFECNSASFR